MWKCLPRRLVTVSGTECTGSPLSFAISVVQRLEAKRQRWGDQSLGFVLREKPPSRTFERSEHAAIASLRTRTIHTFALGDESMVVVVEGRCSHWGHAQIFGCLWVPFSVLILIMSNNFFRMLPESFFLSISFQVSFAQN